MEQGQGAFRLSDRVLVVDDDVDSRDLLCGLLTDAGFRPLRCYDGGEAMLFLHSVEPRFVVLDLAMPRVTGWDVLAAMKRDPALASIPVVVVAGRSLKASGLKRSDVFAYLEKPLDLEKFGWILDYFRRHTPHLEGAPAR